MVAAPVISALTHSHVPWILAFYGAVFMAAPRANVSEARLRDIEDQLDFIDFQESDIDLRAERQFKSHQLELKRYYDQTLAQTRWVFYLGVVCVIMGLTIAGGTIYAVTTLAGTIETKLIVGIVGGIGTILTNFVAAIYLKMHTGTVESLTRFHNRLVSTHHLHFAYFVA